MGWGFYYVAIRAIGIPETTTFQAALSTAEARYRSTLTQFNDFRHSSQGSHHAFTNKRRKLDTLHRRWNELPAKRASGLQKLEAERQKQQLEKFLGNFFIDHAKIKDIGPGRKATLASYGIETAADVTRRRVKKVPGFGNAMTARLLDWRNELSLKFTFDPTQAVDPMRIIDLDQEITKEKRQIEKELITGATELSQLKRQAEQHYMTLRRAAQEAAYAVAQARVDQCAALGGS